VESPLLASHVSVLTYKYDNQRSGENRHEYLLNASNVNAHQFGALTSYQVDGQVYAQPLYAPGIRIGDHLSNLVIVATEHDSVYAFDARRTGSHPTPLWHTSLLRARMSTVPAWRLHCTDLQPQIGITSTPVIDSTSGTLFVVAYVQKQGWDWYELHALDLRNGHDRYGSPIQINPGFLGSTKERQRSGLLLVNGRMYFAFASFCDIQPYHGGIVSYSYDRRGFHRLAVYNDTPRGREGGIWSTGSALAADLQGTIYAISGNGTFDLDRGGPDAGDSFLKLTKNLRVIDYFTPFNQSCLAASDFDLGSGGPLLIPGHLLIGGGKEGRLYVVNTRHMGHFRQIANPCKHQQATTIDQVLYETAPHAFKPIFSTPASWHGPDGQYLFVSGVRDHTRAFKLSSGQLSAATSATPETFAYSGGDPVISCNGNTPGSAILWLITAPGYLRAYDATDLSHELYSGSTGSYNKFTVPVVADGKVFVATQNALTIYGLLPAQSGSRSLSQLPRARVAIHLRSPDLE
jgi:outer membrane protein assembly factor BamB